MYYIYIFMYNIYIYLSLSLCRSIFTNQPILHCMLMFFRGDAGTQMFAGFVPVYIYNKVGEAQKFDQLVISNSILWCWATWVDMPPHWCSLKLIWHVWLEISWADLVNPCQCLLVVWFNLDFRHHFPNAVAQPQRLVRPSRARRRTEKISIAVPKQGC